MGFKLLTVAFASLLAFNAHANNTDWGTHGTLELGTSLAAPGEIDDTYSFVLASGASVVSSAVSLSTPGVLNMVNGTVKLYKELGIEDALQGSYTFDGSTGSVFHTFDISGPGGYYYQVLGQATGVFGGYYALSSATAVPEPSTLAMVTLAGLMAVGGLCRRRLVQPL